MKYAMESYLLQERNNYSSTMNQILWYWDVRTCCGAKRLLCLPATENTRSDLLLAAGTVRHTFLWQGRKAVGTALGEPAEYSQNASKILTWLPLALHPLDAKILDILHLHFNHSRYPPLLTIKLIQCSKIHRMEELKIPAILSLSCLIHHMYIP